MDLKKDIELPLLAKSHAAGTQTQKNDNDISINIKTPNLKRKFVSHFTKYLNTPEDQAKYAPRPPFLKWITFTDMLPHAKRMNKETKELGLEDIPNPDNKFNVDVKVLELDYQWSNELKSKNPSFYRALYKTFFTEIFQAFILVLIENFSKVLYSIYMGKIISIITSSNVGEEVDSDELFFSATLVSILVIVSIFAKSWSFFLIAPNLAKSRLAISGLLYKKLNSTSLTSLHEIKIGRVINLIGNDINDIQHLFFVPVLLITPFMIAISTYVMWGYFGPSCLIGLASTIGVLFGQGFLSDLTGPLRQENKKLADERVKYTHEVIEAIRLIKMYAWDHLFKNKITSLRENEHKTFIKMTYIEGLGINFSGLSVYLNLLLICIVYTLIGGVLSPEKVYATMMILMFLSGCLLWSQMARTNLVNVKVILNRVQELLAVKDVLLKEETLIENRESVDERNKESRYSVEFKNFTGYWSQTAQNPCLSNINLTFKQNTLTAVIGKIGSGKTSLLLSFLREMPVIMGTLDFSGKIAYVEQDPIIFSGTFRHNILFGRVYDEARYKKVIEDCRLSQDLELFSHGDLTLIGERGVNLSGGQKARVSLARALYSESDIYLLDDPFSALDSKVAREIFDKAIKGNLAKKKTVILVTHHLHFAKESNYVVLMNEGKVEAEGSFEELESLNIKLLNIFKIESQRKISENLRRSENKEEQTEEQKPEILISKSQEKAHKEESIQVSWKTYKDYCQIVGTKSTFLVLGLLFILSHTLMIYFARFVGYWAEQHTIFENNEKLSEVQEFNHSYFITTSLVLFLFIFWINYAKIMKIYMFFFSTNTELHRRMLNGILRSKILFFDINPVGRILNRFSNDLGIFDKLHARISFDCLDNLVNYLFVLITVSFINPRILLPIFLVLYGLYKIRIYFEKPMSTVKRLEIVSKGPLISAIPATLQGLIIIRTYNQGGKFVKDFMNMIFDNIKAFVFLEKTIRLFGFLLDTPIQFLTISAIWIFIVLIFEYHIEAGLIGLSLMYLLKIGDQGSMMIRQTLFLDINMQSAQRMIDYSRLKSEAPLSIEEVDSQIEKEFKGKWPIKGEIIFNKVYLKYREDLNFALNGLTLKVQGGLKVACVGRTGAGKSSIIQALFRMVEMEKGPNFEESHIKIDGVDIASIGLNLLRSRLSIIPQTPVMFADTIRRNLDPFGKLSDDKLWNVLKEVDLKDYVASLANKLDTDITVSSNVFSTGQKQLVCLARAIISKSKVIILDEATANVDVETDSFIQKAIMEKFKDCTVLTIAHRLITIANYDKVVVVDQGYVVEYDSPYKLLVQHIGDTQITKINGIFADMVRSTGRSMANKIFNIARDHYFLSEKRSSQ